MYDFQEQILNKREFQNFREDKFKKTRLIHFIKNHYQGYINSNKYTYPKTLFVINVIKQFSLELGVKNNTIVLEKMAWDNCLRSYSKELDLNLKFHKKSLLDIDLKQILLMMSIKNRQLFIFIKDLVHFRTIFKEKSSLKEKIYIEGRGNISLDEKGSLSDFFILQNSKIDPKSIAYRLYNKEHKEKLKKTNIHLISKRTQFYDLPLNEDYSRIEVENNFKGMDEKEIIYFYDKYCSEKSYWYSFLGIIM